ncbi:MAG: 2,3-bisphosphoglycerate-independent phosphoglycerate mutase [candidate division Zixibacteria bacterium]|nr:2,3-bisphosphoglycerate-independent phosphoglycerate mutase [candidate division Zixibacteria bacterium]
MILLLVMDGYGINHKEEGNAIALARKPHLDRLFADYPHTVLGASGLDVGLPEGQMGNSEVGHLNFGAGRIVYQEITRIDKAIKDGSFFQNQVLLEAMNKVRENNSALHLMGLVSDGGVHSSLNHLYALLSLAKDNGISKVYVHAFMDGRDTSPTAGKEFIKGLLEKFREYRIGKLSTIVGRYYAMDRDKRWERVEKAYRAMIYGEGKLSSEPVKAVEESYREEVTDEFIKPIVVTEDGDPLSGRIKEKDVGLFFNFRADRARELSYVLTDKEFRGFDKGNNLAIHLVTLTQYDEKLKTSVAFPPVRLKNILPEVLSKKGLKQLRIAETEKYAHVTFFFNGGEEKPFEGEDRILIHSPKVPTYDLKPEMSAYEVTDSAVQEILSRKYDFILLNYANPDMVGHTGILEAAIKAIETVDACVGRVVDAVQKTGGLAMVTSDHGNAEMMVDYESGESFTAHTTDLVPFVLVKDGFKGKLREKGILADVAPTIISLMGIPKPAEMDGENLIIQ